MCWVSRRSARLRGSAEEIVPCWDGPSVRERRRASQMLALRRPRAPITNQLVPDGPSQSEGLARVLPATLALTFGSPTGIRAGPRKACKQNRRMKCPMRGGGGPVGLPPASALKHVLYAYPILAGSDPLPFRCHFGVRLWGIPGLFEVSRPS